MEFTSLPLTRQAALELRARAESGMLSPNPKVADVYHLVYDAMTTWEAGADVRFHSYGVELDLPREQYRAPIGGVCLLGAAMCGRDMPANVTILEDSIQEQVAAEYNLSVFEVRGLISGFDAASFETITPSMHHGDPAMFGVGYTIGRIVLGAGLLRRVRRFIARALLPAQTGLASDPQYLTPYTLGVQWDRLTDDMRKRVGWRSAELVDPGPAADDQNRTEV